MDKFQRNAMRRAAYARKQADIKAINRKRAEREAKYAALEAHERFLEKLRDLEADVIDAWKRDVEKARG